MIGKLDYLIFRLYSFYKRNGNQTPVFMGCLVLTMMIFITLINILQIGALFGVEIFGEIIILAIVGIASQILLYRRYQNYTNNSFDKYELIPDRTNKKYDTYIAIYIIGQIITFLMLSYIKNNVGIKLKI